MDDPEGAGFNPEQDKSSSQFSSKELEQFRFLKDQADKGKIGGKGDQPNQNQEFTQHPEPEQWKEIDPEWRDLPLELREEFQEKFGEEVATNDRSEFVRRYKEWLKETGFDEYLPEETREGSLQERLEEIIRRDLPAREAVPREVKKPENFITNIPGGGYNEIFYQALMEQYPELGLYINNGAKGLNGKTLSWAKAVWTVPEKTFLAKTAIDELWGDPILEVISDLANDGGLPGAFPRLRRAEQSGLVPEGSAERLMVMGLSETVNFDESRLTRMTPPEKRAHEDNKRRLARTKSIPMTENEIKDFLKPQFERILGPSTQLK